MRRLKEHGEVWDNESKKYIHIPKTTKDIVTVSSGNHALNISYVCKEYQTNPHIIVVRTAPRFKIKQIENMGAEVYLVDNSPEERERKNKEVHKNISNSCILHPYADMNVILGQSTMGTEFFMQMGEYSNEDNEDNVDCILVPVSGGGMLAGVCVASFFYKLELYADQLTSGEMNIEELRVQKPYIIGVEPLNSDDAYKSFYAKKRVE